MFQEKLGKKIGYTVVIVVVLEIIYSLIKLIMINLSNFTINYYIDKIIFGLIIAFSVLFIQYIFNK
ncbi:MAG: hypothetical protein GX275_04950 [Clostridiales bacterium]|nr:hypothetical protein [Clostridiales bacterium]